MHQTMNEYILKFIPVGGQKELLNAKTTLEYTSSMQFIVFKNIPYSLK